MNPTPIYGNYFSFFTMQGEDSEDFMHRISTIPVLQLKEKELWDGFFLSALGKIQAFFTLYKKSKNEFVFLVYDESLDYPWKKSFQETIEHFQFSEKFQLSELLKNESPLFFKDRFSDNLSEKTRIEKMIPKCGKELVLQEVNPLEVGLAQTLSRTKGCYPGQEVIERIQAKGAPAQRLCLVEGKAVPADLIYTRNENQKCGRVTSADTDSGKFLALVSKLHAEVGRSLSVGENKTEAHILKVSEYQN